MATVSLEKIAAGQVPLAMARVRNFNKHTLERLRLICSWLFHSDPPGML